MTAASYWIVSTTSIDGKVRGGKKGQRLASIVPMPEKVLGEIHKTRAKFDAIMVGANTVKADDPSLTVRYFKTKKTPYRITVSQKADLNPNSKIFDSSARTVLITTSRASNTKTVRLRQKRVVIIDTGEKIDFVKASQKLAKLGIKKIMVEGGPILIASLLKTGLVRGVTLITYPMVLNDAKAPLLFKDEPRGHIITLHLQKCYQIEGFAFRIYEIDQT